jgi:hypothetical protein
MNIAAKYGSPNMLGVLPRPAYRWLALIMLVGCASPATATEMERTSGGEDEQASLEVARSQDVPCDLANPEDKEVDDALKDPLGAVAGLHRDSVACDDPSGNKTKYMWSNAGTVSVTVWFDNRCSHEVGVALVYEKDGDRPRLVECLSARGGTKGARKFRHEPIPGYFLRAVAKGCPTPG